ncbi:PTS sugar transporter subunit IIA [Niallia oryzisoli]|uniref:PTS sugar transporter subunit IIA n=1 Tax=Niallia oryzisoli TaxID=1737571 RepID=A0ABZ2CK33_9BACI
MANRAVLVITHGEFGIELVKSAEMIMGPQEDVDALALRPGDSVDDLRSQAYEVVDRNAEKGLETIVLVDLLGGSPSNVSLTLLAKHDLKILTGVSMPMLIETLSQYKFEEDTDKLIEAAKQTAGEGVKLLDRAFIGRK